MMNRATRSLSMMFLVTLGMLLVAGCTATGGVAKKVEKHEGRNKNIVPTDERPVIKKYFKKEQYKNTAADGKSPDPVAKRQSYRRHLKKKKSSSWSSSWSSSVRRQREHKTSEQNQWWYSSSFTNEKPQEQYIPYNPNWNYQLSNPYVPNPAPIGPTAPTAPTPMMIPTAPTAPFPANNPVPPSPVAPSDPTIDCEVKDCARPPRPWEVQE